MSEQYYRYEVNGVCQRGENGGGEEKKELKTDDSTIDDALWTVGARVSAGQSDDDIVRRVSPVTASAAAAASRHTSILYYITRTRAYVPR